MNTFNEQLAAKLMDIVVSARPSMNPSPGSELGADEYLAHALDARARMLDEYATAVEEDPAGLPRLLRLHALRLRRVARQMEADPVFIEELAR